MGKVALEQNGPRVLPTRARRVTQRMLGLGREVLLGDFAICFQQSLSAGGLRHLSSNSFPLLAQTPSAKARRDVPAPRGAQPEGIARLLSRGQQLRQQTPPGKANGSKQKP